MRGILWKWLFSFGLIFWVALCTADYYRKNIEKHPEYLENTLTDEEMISLPIKKAPPALTFWKTLSMVLSVSALVFIKRSSTGRKYPKSKLMLSYPIREDYDEFSYSRRTYSNASAFPTFRALKTNHISPDLYSNASKRSLGSSLNTSVRPGIDGVEIVQKKLENLERSVASLKQRHQSSGMVSGSPEFQKFLSTCKNISSASDISNISINSSGLSETVNIPGNGLVFTTSSSEELLKQKSHHVLDSANSSNCSFQSTIIFNGNKDASEEKLCHRFLENISEGNESPSVNFSGQTNDSSWSTISEDALGSNTDIEVANAPPALKIIPTQITEILQIKDGFPKSSKASEIFEISDRKSLSSFQSNITATLDRVVDDEDDHEVPGSTLVSTSGSTSICSSSTMMSSSSNNVNSLMQDSSVYSFDDDILLNTLD